MHLILDMVEILVDHFAASVRGGVGGAPDLINIQVVDCQRRLDFAFVKMMKVLRVLLPLLVYLFQIANVLNHELLLHRISILLLAEFDSLR